MFVKKWSLLIALLIVIAVLAYGSALDSFTVGFTSENLTFTGDHNITRYLSVPYEANVTSASVSLMGYLKPGTSDFFADGMLVYYEFENNTNDTSAMDMTQAPIVGVPNFIPGKVGESALNFSDGLLLRNLSGTNLIWTRTFDLWLYLEHYQSTGSRILMMSDPGDSIQSDLRLNATGGLTFAVSHSGLLLRSNNSLPLTTWTHIVATTDGTEGLLYVNAVQEDNFTTGSVIGGDGYARIDIGAESGGGNIFNGSIDNAYFSQYSYNYTDVLLSYNNGLGLNFSDTSIGSFPSDRDLEIGGI